MVENKATPVDHFGITPCGGVLSVFVVAFVVIVFDTSLQIEAVDDLPVGSDTTECAINHFFAGHTVDQPPRVIEVDVASIPYLFTIVAVGKYRFFTRLYYRNGQPIGTSFGNDVIVFF